MVQLLVNLVEFHPHLTQGGDEFPLDVPGLFLWHGNRKVLSLKRLVHEAFGMYEADTKLSACAKINSGLSSEGECNSTEAKSGV